MHKGVLKSLAKETKKQKISKNAFLIAALNKAFLQYAQENLFFYFSEVNQWEATTKQQKNKKSRIF